MRFYALFILSMGFVGFFPFSVIAQEIIPTPQIESLSFDRRGRLVAQVSQLSSPGCSLVIWAGTTSNTIDDIVTSHTVTADEHTQNYVTFRTRRKYACPQRTMYIYVVSECYPVGASRSSIRVLRVPRRNREN
jgi:hypothetical protein